MSASNHRTAALRCWRAWLLGAATLSGSGCGTEPAPVGTLGTTQGDGTRGVGSSETTVGATGGGTAFDTTAGSTSTGDEPPVQCARGGFHIQDGRLRDGNGNEFIMRGVNYPYAWYSWRDDTAQQFADMAGAGANAVRVVLTNGAQWERVDGRQVTQVIDWARDNEMVAVLEVHDATGWSEQVGAADPQTAIDYWLSPDIRAAIDGQEAYVIINIANEPLGNTTTDQWGPLHSGAITQLRAAGLRHTLVVDAPNWGQDWSNTMRDGVVAQEIFDADPEANVMFSVHMYEVYETDTSVQEYVADFLATGLPLMVGEFAADHGGAPVAAASILSTCEAMGVGYLGWSWAGNSRELSSLDIARGFSVRDLSPWGELLIDGPNGLRATSEISTCFGR